MQPKNRLIEIKANCSGCGNCVAACPVHALTLVTERPDGFGRKTATVDRQGCVGCGACLPACPHHALSLICT